ncbi:6954_t:CDS:2 [Diversispora eburnea]|uniref:6954_t:CDS:1 n=1 Tax=Diversispora eburnea TaxID=1213867 RepID=A0A9N8V2J4_9GLOM|nr:6954_t:CDS:2 [Diversispora eburnea]
MHDEEDPPPAYQDIFPNESTPFISTNNTKSNNREQSFPVCGFLSILILLFLSFNTILVSRPEEEPDDTTRVPEFYQLRWRSRFDSSDFTYIIEATSCSLFITRTNYIGDNDTSYDSYDNINYNNEDDDVNVEEFFYKPSQDNFYKKLITANGKFESHWPAEFLITFTTKGNVRDPSAIEGCDYKILINENLTGNISRKCWRIFESEFTIQAYVRGSVENGLTFFDEKDSKLIHAYTKKPQSFWNYKRRDIFVHSYAPFPSVIPALYSVYYDFVILNLKS